MIGERRGRRNPPPQKWIRQWGSECLFKGGYLAMPLIVFTAKLDPPITEDERTLLLHLMWFKRDADAPFPANSTIAARLGVSVRTVRRRIASIEGKGYLRRIRPRGAEDQRNRFDLTGWFSALARACSSVPPPEMTAA
jgi:Helix-turn-helix domain